VVNQSRSWLEFLDKYLWTEPSFATAILSSSWPRQMISRWISTNHRPTRQPITTFSINSQPILNTRRTRVTTQATLLHRQGYKVLHLPSRLWYTTTSRWLLLPRWSWCSKVQSVQGTVRCADKETCTKSSHVVESVWRSSSSLWVWSVVCWWRIDAVVTAGLQDRGKDGRG